MRKIMKQGMGNMGTWIGEHGKEQEVNSNGKKKRQRFGKEDTMRQKNTSVPKFSSKMIKRT
jgi:hypothetical protein